jgi:gamma-glutamylcyclotransferase (GGCT)/AIG2-like uncharacterized protein YtfP
VRYFAYGSNMAAAQIGAGARFLRPARLEGYRLALTRRSIRWKAGVLDIVVAEGHAVWGALFELDQRALEAIDLKEAAGSSYRRIEIDVEGEPAMAYEVIAKEPEEIPSTPAYAEVVLAGARQCGLPEEWMGELARILGTTAS